MMDRRIIKTSWRINEWRIQLERAIGKLFEIISIYYLSVP